MSEAAEVPSSLQPSSHAEPARPAETDFLRFDHPVRELPDLLAVLERTAAEQPEGPREKRLERETPVSRCQRARRRALLSLAATGAVFLSLQLSGFLPEVFSLHMPLLVFAAVLVVGSTVPRVPAGTPQLKNPIDQSFLVAILLLFIGGSMLQVEGRPTPAYMALGVLTLLPLLWILWRSKAAASAPRRSGAAETEPPRQILLAACREVLRTIGRHAPRGARATGWLDLTGAEQQSKQVRSDRKGRRHYRDVWWRLRLPWEDGVRLRLAGIEQVRVEPDSPLRKRTFLLLATLAVDPRRWRTERQAIPGNSIGRLVVEALEVTPSRVSARAVSTAQAFQPADLVNLIKALEKRLHPLSKAGSSDEEPAGGVA